MEKHYCKISAKSKTAVYDVEVLTPEEVAEDEAKLLAEQEILADYPDPNIIPAPDLSVEERIAQLELLLLESEGVI